LAPWQDRDLASGLDFVSPSGSTEIRKLCGVEAAELVHATLPAGRITKPAVLEATATLIYVIDGSGELRRRPGPNEDVTDMRPGRCLCIPPGVSFQCRSGDEALVALVSTALARPGSEAVELPPPKDLPFAAEYLAPDGSEIRQLLETPEGGLAHCLLPAGRTTRAVRHRTVSEIWFVLAGTGKVWRHTQEDEPETPLKPGRCVTIPRGAHFQFRAGAGAPLELMLGTYPRWPGADEAVPVPGQWEVSLA
jgi:mannose-6-phosphate isomerase-like protein (cupin superfamily)